MPRPDRALIERFHHRVIRMLRSLRPVDEAGSISGPRASALSILVFRGPCSLGELAGAEGVKAPTMSRLVKAMEAEGLLRVAVANNDQRRVRIEASPRGRKLMLEARERRLAALALAIGDASAAELAALERVCSLLERAF